MKIVKRLFMIPVILLLCFCPKPLCAAETDTVDIDTKELESFISDLDRDYKDVLGDFSFKSCFNKIKTGDLEINLNTILQGLWQYLCGESKGLTQTVGKLLFLGVLASVLEVFHRQNSDSRIAEMLIALVFMLIAVKTLGTAMEIGMESIRKAADVLYGVLPIILGAFTLSGSIMAVSVVQPTVLAAIAVFMGLVDRFFLPLVLLQGGLTVCSHLNSNFPLKNLSSLVQQIVMLTLGLVMTVFTGILGLQSFASGTVDGLALKTVKAAAGSFIPVVGSYISEAFDAILGAGLLLRSSIGLFGAGVLGFIILLPCLKLLIMALSFRLTAGLLEPFGCRRYLDALNDFASVIFTLFAVVVVAGLLFFFLIFCIVAVSSATVMYR